MENLKCPICGSDITYRPENLRFGDIWNFYCSSKTCKISNLTFYANTESEAIAAWKLATRADVKQGIQWISVKDRLPEKSGMYLIYCDKIGTLVEYGYINLDVYGSYIISPVFTHWAEINLPEKD